MRWRAEQRLRATFPLNKLRCTQRKKNSPPLKDTIQSCRASLKRPFRARCAALLCWPFCVRASRLTLVACGRQADTEQQRSEVMSQLSVLEREFESQHCQNAADRKQLEDLARARDDLTKQIMTSGHEKEVKESLLKVCVWGWTIHKLNRARG